MSHRQRCNNATLNCRNWNKVRIIALYVQNKNGVSAEDLERLFLHANLSHAERDAVKALKYLGVEVTRVRLVLVHSFHSNDL